MSFVLELRSSLENPQTPLSFPAEWLLDMLSGGRTDSGIRVSEMTALQVSTVYACVNLISKSVGSLPLNVYEHLIAKDLRAGKRVAFDHDIYALLHDSPNEEMSSMTFRRTLQTHGLLWGNMYGEIQRDDVSRIVAIWPRNPARTYPVRVKGQLVYRTTEGVEEASDPNGKYEASQERTILKENMIHIPGLSIDGRLGASVVQLARQAIGLTLAAEKFGSKLFANYGRPGGVLQTAQALTDVARNNLKKTWAESQGGENTHTVPVLEEGLTWKDTANKPNEAQFIELRHFQKEEICSIFAVPPHMVGVTDKQNRANTEQIGIEFVNYALAPWLVSWEQEFKRKLFPRSGRNANKFFAMHDTRRLLMPDAASRQSFYVAGKQWGFLSTNDIRELEHLNPIDDPDADALWIPLNMVKAGAQSNPNDDEDLANRYVKAYFRLFRDAFGRITVRSEADSAAFMRAFLPVLGTIAEQIGAIAGLEARQGSAENNEIECFLVEYVNGMRQRLDEWRSSNGSADQVADRELARAIKAISIEVFRAAGAAKAKAQLKE